MKWISSYFIQKWIYSLLLKNLFKLEWKRCTLLLLTCLWTLGFKIASWPGFENFLINWIGGSATTWRLFHHSLRSNLTFFSFISSVGSSLREVDFSQQVGLEVGSIFKSLFLCFIMRRDLLLMRACCCFEANLDFKKVQFEEWVLDPHAIFTVMDKTKSFFLYGQIIKLV